MASKKKTPKEVRMDTIILTKDVLASWQRPTFQRPVRVTAKVESCAEEIKKTQEIPGVITLGVLDGVEYLLDGQHRSVAFELSTIPEAICNVRYYHADDMADMGEEFVRLNSSLVKLKPDDILRGLEGHSEALQYIRKRCPFVGYDMIRRGPRSPIVSMSVMLRCWAGAATETPGTGGGSSAAQIARTLTPEDAKNVTDFIALAEKAWGRDPEYSRLYSTLNMVLVMWLYRRVVVTPYVPGVTTMFTSEQFRSCLTALSADPHYLDHLVGRNLTDRERSPTYNRLKTIIARRFQHEVGKKARMPSPPWATSKGAA